MNNALESQPFITQDRARNIGPAADASFEVQKGLSNNAAS